MAYNTPFSKQYSPALDDWAISTPAQPRTSLLQPKIWVLQPPAPLPPRRCCASHCARAAPYRCSIPPTRHPTLRYVTLHVACFAQKHSQTWGANNTLALCCLLQAGDAFLRRWKMAPQAACEPAQPGSFAQTAALKLSTSSCSPVQCQQPSGTPRIWWGGAKLSGRLAATLCNR